mmetsp:Transcript_107060/g.302751  ORF Transcript_107060/g.302751 Transcript_107060/m.302751 type:complete len:338 (-) Transcript_107060:388-1401(-)
MLHNGFTKKHRRYCKPCPTHSGAELDATGVAFHSRVQLVQLLQGEPRCRRKPCLVEVLRIPVANKLGSVVSRGQITARAEQLRSPQVRGLWCSPCVLRRQPPLPEPLVNAQPAEDHRGAGLLRLEGIVHPVWRHAEARRALDGPVPPIEAHAVGQGGAAAQLETLDPHDHVEAPRGQPDGALAAALQPGHGGHRRRCCRTRPGPLRDDALSGLAAVDPEDAVSRAVAARDCGHGACLGFCGSICWDVDGPHAVLDGHGRGSGVLRDRPKVQEHGIRRQSATQLKRRKALVHELELALAQLGAVCCHASHERLGALGRQARCDALEVEVKKQLRVLDG